MSSSQLQKEMSAETAANKRDSMADAGEDQLRHMTESLKASSTVPASAQPATVPVVQPVEVVAEEVAEMPAASTADIPVAQADTEDVKIPLKIMMSKGFEDKPPGMVEKGLCGCYPLVLRLILTAAMGSFLFGFNLSLLNTSINTIAAEFHWCEVPADTDCNNTILLKAFITTAVFIGAALGSMTGGRFLYIGRRMLMLVTMIVFMIGIISSCMANSFTALLWARLIVGYGVGVVSVIVPIYMSEMTPANVRGAYGVLHQLFITIGIFVGVLIGIPLEAFPTTDDHNYATFQLNTFDKVWWRVMLGIGIIPVLILIYFLTYIFTFETPHYYVENNRPHQAEKLLKRLYAKEDVALELQSIAKARDDAQTAKAEGLTFFAAFKVPVYRHVILIGCLLSAFQQLTGINVFIASSNKLFEDANLDRSLVTIMSIVLTFVNVIMTFPAIYLIEKLGRRTLLLIGVIGMTVAVLPGAVLFWANDGAAVTTWIGIAGAIVFIIFFSVSYGPILWVYLFEIYPIEIKGVASGLATAVNWVAGIVMVFITQFISIEINYTIFAVMGLIAILLVFFLMRETKGRSLENSPYMVDEDGVPIKMQLPA